MVSHNFTFIILGFILLVIGLVLVDSLKNWSFVLMIIGVLVALKGIIPMRKRSSEKDSDNVEKEEESGKVNEEPEGEDDEAESEEDHKFCRECGEKIPKETEYCPNCRAEQ